MSENLQRIGQQVAAAISQNGSEFEGFMLRCDPGEPGMIYVALRGAKRETAVGERLAEKLDALVGAELAKEQDLSLTHTILMGRGDKDLLLRVEISRSGA
ncbi:hypothetical protein FRC96_00055 [Lujinxingia vulgaris]|uniref:Ribosome-binding factor A n=1 Tax=Lujinxingia vulgaris TaxID=2600176 RepID=A0A5C6XGB0_9DELT|nr:hypothetical protein [Lujinxingia vulgaris]TXD44752.1 hypothetical protein FRC96_00055 [Lujinxingia vulgaris]